MTSQLPYTCESGQSPGDVKYTFFYGNTPFSQWHPSVFIIDDIAFNCAEQWMMYSKAWLFGDDASAKAILAATDPKVQKQLGRDVVGYVEAMWVEVRERIVKAGNRAKFTQNPDMLQALLDTAGTVLVEASPYDVVWGIGFRKSDPLAQDPRNWRGLNLLGKVLTELRAELMAQRSAA